jgi:uncharacterized protein (TIRG00374 family)
MKNDKLLHFIRIFVSIGIIISIFWFVDTEKIPSIKDVDLRLVSLVLVLTLFDSIVNAYKWSILVRSAGLKVNFKRLLKIYFTSGFVGLALPSGIGGELLKGYGLAKTTSKTIDSASSVVVGRITGLLGLTFLCVIGYLAAGPSLKDTSAIVNIKNISLLITIVSILAITFGFFIPEEYVLPQKKDGKIKKFLRKVFRSFYQYKKEYYALVITFAISILIHVVRSVTVYISSLSVGVEINFVYFLIFVPFVQLGGVIPMTMGGVGVKEGIAVYLFSIIGVSGASALSMYIIVRIMAVASVGPGAWIYFQEGLITRKPGESSQEIAESTT